MFREDLTNMRRLSSAGRMSLDPFLLNKHSSLRKLMLGLPSTDSVIFSKLFFCFLSLFCFLSCFVLLVGWLGFFFQH